MWGVGIYPIIILLVVIYCGVVDWSWTSPDGFKLPKVDLVQKNPLEENIRKQTFDDIYLSPKKTGSVIEPKTDQEITAAQIIDENLRQGRDTPIEDIL